MLHEQHNQTLLGGAATVPPAVLPAYDLFQAGSIFDDLPLPGTAAATAVAARGCGIDAPCSGGGVNRDLDIELDWQLDIALSAPGFL